MNQNNLPLPDHHEKARRKLHKLMETPHGYRLYSREIFWLYFRLIGLGFLVGAIISTAVWLFVAINF